ncbi:MAG: 2-C-methyl-D-erythritol 4-phosphate cytidylyltransferase [Clostridiales bacterium]|nr:2-C-methyl-D-erythritol 4-phosphate cytidylyltransferase [Clostridiales bacterium]
MTFDAIIVASGEGRRFSCDVPKQFLEFGGKTVIQTTVDAFLSCEGLRRIAVVLPPLRMNEFSYLFDEYKNTGKLFLVAGGKTRQESVYNGLCALTEHEPVVCIHDGVRPLIEKSVIMDSVNEAYKGDGCITAVNVADTVRYVSNEGVCVKTVDRDNLVFVQTPQTFKYDIIAESHKKAVCDGFSATDDGELVMHYGYKVTRVMGKSTNIKITTQGDMELARYLLSTRRENGEY